MTHESTPKKPTLRELIALLREEIALGHKCAAGFLALRQALVENPSGGGVPKAVAEIEPSLIALGRLTKRQETMLAARGEKRVLSWIAHAGATEERTTALRLFRETAELQKTMRQDIKRLSGLLAHSKDFIDFQINILTRARASDTYAKEGTEDAATRDIKMFDANI